MIPVVFVLAGVMTNLATARFEHPAPQRALGGPEAIDTAPLLSDTLLSAALRPVIFNEETISEAKETDQVAIETAAVTNFQGIFAGSIARRENLVVYKVRSGDTLSEIAWKFGVSLETLRWANPKVVAGRLQIGQEILVPPLSGVIHSVSDGESFNDIANTYGIPVETIKDANKNLTEGVLRLGAQVVVPGGKPRKSTVTTAASRWPNLRSYFILPAKGWNWGRLHNYNAVDIANSCGTPILAAAEGLIVRTGSPLSWNGGYGGYIEIQHPNGTFTLYAHTQKNLFTDGEYVKKGDIIAEMGRTGNTHGPTGCHLHFETKNAQNPLAK